jgi:predicted TIM-barrel fold metal-dependent hydrolase
LVIAHMGLPEYGEFFDLVEAYDGLHLDTTMAFTDFTEAMHPFPRELTPRLVDLADRIVFGSDFPNIPYPYVEGIEALERLDLGDDWLRGVLYENAARLFA